MNAKNTTIHAFEIFLAVAREKNFSEVARRYDVASSVISRQIKQLEDDFGQTLFYRNTRSMILTQAGEQFAQHAQQLLTQYQALCDELNQTDSEPAGIIRINAPVFFGQKHIPPICLNSKPATPNWKFISPKPMILLTPITKPPI